MRWLDSITNSMHMNFSKLREIVKNRETCCPEVMGLQRVGLDLVTKEHNV